MSETQRLSAEAFTRSLNGFEELAIQRMFKAGLGDLRDTMAPRALLFVQNKREGMKDADAFKASMEMTLGDMETRFEKAEVTEDPEAGGTPSSPTS